MKTLKNLLLLLGAVMTVTSFYSCEPGDFSLGHQDDNNEEEGSFDIINSNCVDGVISQLTGNVKLDIDHSDMGFGIKTPYLNGLGNHVQGIGRLSDKNGMGRMVLTENGTGRGLRVAFQPIKNATEGLYSTVNELSDVVSFDIHGVSAYGNHDHPGGLQAQGDYIAVAMEGGNTKHAAVYFLKVEDRNIEFVTSLVMNGSRGEPYQTFKSAAATAGFVQLASGHFLVAVSGKNHGRQGIWFYESTTRFIDETTEWNFISFKDFGCIGYGEEQDECYVGAGGGLNLVTDCSGNIYMLAMHGSDDGAFDKDDEWLQVFRVWRTNNEITLQKVTQQKDKLGLWAINHKSFRWAGGAYTSNDGILAIFNTERRRLLNDNDYVDGHVYLGKK